MYFRILLLAIAALVVLIPGKRMSDAAATPMPQPAPKLIAISFDDAPRAPGAFMTPADRAAKLIAALKASKVEQAVFFVNSARINKGDGDEARLDAYVAAGHVIANHSATHPRLSGTAVETYLEDIDANEKWLKGRAGYRPWFRFPFLDEGSRDKAKRDAIRAGLKARGLRNAHVTVDGSDWNMEALCLQAKRAGKTIDMAALRDLYVETHLLSAEFTEALTLRTVGRSAPQVLLLHETDLAALFLPDLIAALRKAGWEVVSNDIAYADPIYALLPDAPVASGTLIEALAWERGVTGKRWYDRNNVDIANALFRERVLHEKAE